jgi:hypothetical protein
MLPIVEGGALNVVDVNIIEADAVGPGARLWSSAGRWYAANG